MDASPHPTWIVLGRTRQGYAAALLDATGAELSRTADAVTALARWVARVEREAAPRWVWHDTPGWHAALLADGVRVARCHDLRLCHAILRDSALVGDESLRAAHEWDAASATDATDAGTPALFELDGASAAAHRPPDDLDAAVAEFARQRAALAASSAPGRLRLLLAAESAGALVATELRAAGLPWDAVAHDRLLTDVLGARPTGTGVPARIDELGARVRALLGDPTAGLDSQPKLLRALHRIGLQVESTSKWQLAEQKHPVIEPLLEYKQLTRLVSANGWAWLLRWNAHEVRGSSRRLRAYEAARTHPERCPRGMLVGWGELTPRARPCGSTTSPQRCRGARARRPNPGSLAPNCGSDSSAPADWRE